MWLTTRRISHTHPCKIQYFQSSFLHMILSFFYISNYAVNVQICLGTQFYFMHIFNQNLYVLGVNCMYVILKSYFFILLFVNFKTSSSIGMSPIVSHLIFKGDPKLQDSKLVLHRGIAGLIEPKLEL
jgi:hypothetical protein